MKKCRRVRWLAGSGGLVLLLPSAAQAHTPIKGLGDFASGFLHPFFTPPHILVLLAVGLLLGQRAPLTIKWPAATFAAFAALGLLTTATGKLPGVPLPLLVAVGLWTGALVVAALPLPEGLRLATVAAAAFVLGLDSGVDPGTANMAKAQMLSATWVSLLLCVVNVAFYVSLLPPAQWARIGVRVAGSWIVAIGLLMLAFALRR